MKRFQFLYSVPLLVLLSALSLVGCRDSIFDRSLPDLDNSQQTEVTTDGEFEGGVTLNINYESHALKTPSLRGALSVKQESELKLETTRVMVFDSNDVYQYDAPLTKIERSKTDKQQGSLIVQIKPGKGLGIVVLANLTEKEKGREVSGKKDEILKTFAYSVAQDTDFSSVGIPMFGEVTQVTVDQSTGAVPTLDKTVHLLRAVARVDVGLKMSAVGTSGKDSDFDETASELISTIVEPADESSKKVKWTLLETKFYNAATDGLVVPAEGNYSLDGTKLKATAPTLPATPGKQDLTYEVTDNLLKRTIYVPEVDNPDPEATQNGEETTPEAQEQYLERPYLILKLQYEEVDDANKVKDGGAKGTTYFRVDFLKREGEEATAKYTYLPLLRNHRYKVDIQNIGGLGFDSEDDAKKGPSANIMYNVLVWDESEMSNVKYDGQYMLGVSKNMVKTYKSGGSMQFNVQTSWPKGFKIEDLPEGFTVEPTPSAGNTFATTDEVTLSLTPPDNWAPEGELKEDKEGKYKEVPLTIVAGRMKWNVRVRQYQFDKVDIQFFRDRDLTQPVEFLTIHELGTAMLDPSITNYKLSDFDNKLYFGKNQQYIDKYNKAKFQANGSTPAEEAPWFDMDKANKAAGSESEFTALTSGAVRVFYARIDAPTGSDFTFGPKNGGNEGKGQFIVKDISDTADPALPDDLRMFMVTADEMTNINELFEIKSDEYVFKVKSPDNRMAEATINFDQREYDAAIFVDQEMTDPLFGDSKNPVLLLNGETLNYRLRSNASYYSIVLRQRGSEVTPKSSMNPDSTLVDKAVGILQINGKKWNESVTGDANFNGDPYTITLTNDLTDTKVIRGYADIEAKVLGMPFHFYKAREKELGLISADFVQERHVANSYQMVVNGEGIFIPIEKWINDAAHEYNSQVTSPYAGFAKSSNAGFTWAEFMKQNSLQGISPDDHAYSELLWTDAFSHPNSPTNNVVVGNNDNTPFIAHEVVDYNGKLYLFVKPGKLPGNSVIAIRSTTREPKIPYTTTRYDEPYYHPEPAKNKAILWSFHFVVYPKTIDTAKILNHVLYDDEKKDSLAIGMIQGGVVTRRFFNRNYGALISANEGGEIYLRYSKLKEYFPYNDGTGKGAVKVYKNTEYKAQGMGYQWGRKDPVPLIFEDLSHDFYNEEGKKVSFTLDKSRQADPSRTIVANRMSVRETIERPMYFVPGSTGTAQGNWMTEFGYAPESMTYAESAAWQGSRIWGGSGTVNNADQRADIAQTTRKTHFDPSPYGFVVPTSGFEFTRYFQGTAASAKYLANIPALRANIMCTADESFTQFTSETKMKWLVANCYATRDAPTFNLNSSSGGTANDASATNKSSLTPYRPVLQMECVSDWKEVTKIPWGDDAINRIFHVGHDQKEYKPFYY